MKKKIIGNSEDNDPIDIELDLDDAKIDPEYTSRGFKAYPPLPSEYGGQVKLRESSTATRTTVWLDMASPVNLNEPTGEMSEAVALLSYENLAALHEQIGHLLANHYHLAYYGEPVWDE